MASEPVGDDTTAAREWAELEARCAAAERRVEELTQELAVARARPTEHLDPEAISLFEEPQLISDPTLAADGSDPGVLPMALAGTAVVSAMVALLALVNGELLSPFGLLMVGITLVLGWFAWQTRSVTVEITVSRGIVYIESRRSVYRFDLRSEATRLEVVGRPDDRDWQVRFLRRGLDPFVVDAAMVDPATFLAQLREWRPEL